MQIQCGQCRQLLEVPDGSGGQRTFCPHCGASLEIPDVAELGEPSSPASSSWNKAFSETVVVGSDASPSPSPSSPAPSPSPPPPPDASSPNPYAAPSAFPGTRRYGAATPNGTAVAAFCLGLGSVGSLLCCCFTPIPAFLGIPAVITGTFGMIASRKPGGVGGGFALAGMVLGILATVISATLFLMAMFS